MLLALFFMICFASCVLGAICGIGGGMIIKPALDAIGVLDVAACYDGLFGAAQQNERELSN